MKTYNRIIAYIVAFATVLSLCVLPVSAATPNVSYGTIWDYYVSQTNQGMNFIQHWFNDDICPHSPNANGKHNFTAHHTQVDGEVGDFYICDYCGKSAGEVLKPAYENKVEEMPVNGITSDGSYVWYPNCMDIRDNSADISMIGFMPDTRKLSFYRDGEAFVESNRWFESQVMNQIGAIGFSVRGHENDYYVKYSGSIRPAAFAKLSFNAPISGVYSVYGGIDIDVSYFCGPGYTESSYQFSNGNTLLYSGYVATGDSVGCFVDYDIYKKSDPAVLVWDVRGVSGRVYFPSFKVVPDVSYLTGHEHDYDTDTRPGDVIKIDNVTIIDEQNNYYTDPNSGEQHEINNWTYDYSDRSYHVTTNEGDNITVTYGDENITIQEGDTVYTYNYTIESAPCNHHYEISAEHEPTCTVNGSIVYTCSECGATYTETTPPLGHDWEFVESVPAVIDENENVTEEAYDLYRCRRCGEERRVPVGSSPATDGETETGFFSWLRKWLIAFKEWLNDKLDALRGGGGGNTTVINDLDPNDDPNGGDDNNDPADDRAHSHDDDDGAGWLMWFVRKVTKLAGKAFRGVAGVALEDALDVASDNLDGFKNFYGDKPMDGVDGYAQYDERTVFQ